MRVADTFTESLFTLRELKDIVPTEHPLLPIRQMVNATLLGAPNKSLSSPSVTGRTWTVEAWRQGPFRFGCVNPLPREAGHPPSGNFELHQTHSRMSVLHFWQDLDLSTTGVRQ